MCKIDRIGTQTSRPYNNQCSAIEMSSIKNPKLKKKLSYEKDHPVHPGVEYPKACRKSHPKKKAIGHRRLRSFSKEILENNAEEGSESLIRNESKRIMKSINYFNRGAPLNEVIQTRKINRVGRFARKKGVRPNIKQLHGTTKSGQLKF